MNEEREQFPWLLFLLAAVILALVLLAGKVHIDNR